MTPQRISRPLLSPTYQSTQYQTLAEVMVDLKDPDHLPRDTYPDETTALGHWFGEDLVCTGCGISWKAHQDTRLECEHQPAASDKGGRVLTADAAREIRRLSDTTNTSQREMAEMFGVSRRAVWNVIHGITWKGVK